MLAYEYLEHPADLKIRAYGKTRSALFKNTLRAMSNFLLGRNLTSPPAENKPSRILRKITIEAQDLEILLADFLAECLTLSDINEEIYTDIEFEKFSDKLLKGKLFGFKIEKRAHDIKAVTYHDLEIKKNPDGIWQATVLFDI